MKENIYIQVRIRVLFGKLDPIQRCTMDIFSIISSVLASYFSSIKTDKNNGFIKISSSYWILQFILHFLFDFLMNEKWGKEV